jgi:uncharacterized repeat protein (TIGR03943 family)
VSNRAQAFVVLLFGLVLLRLATSDLLLRFVRSGTRPLVFAAGTFVVLLGIWSLVAAGQDDRRANAWPSNSGAHGHYGASRLAWLAVLPTVAVSVVGPPALGAFTAGRGTRSATLPTGQVFDPLGEGGTARLSVVEFAVRALDHDGRTLVHRPVSMTGFVVKRLSGGFLLARLVISCCAADALPVEVQVAATGSAPAANEWVQVTGTYAGQAPHNIPVLTATSVRPVPMPSDPYDR